MRILKRKMFMLLGMINLFFITTATKIYASGVSSAIESTWSDAQTEIQTVVNNVVFPAISLILAILFFAKLATAYLDYRNNGKFDFMAPAILFFGLIFSLTAPLYIWDIIG